MRKLSRNSIGGLALVAALLGCNLTTTGAPTATTTATVTLTPISQVTIMTSTPAGGQSTSQPGSATATTRPAATTAPTSVPPTAVPPSNTPRPTPTWEGVTEVNIYLIAMEDNGASGAAVGCGDSVIPVKRVLSQPTQSPLRVAYTELLSQHDQFYGESGLYNALYQSNLSVESVSISDGTAIVHLTGTLTQGGECDSPRIKAQLEYTALQFATVDDVEVSINGTPIDDVLSLK